jgi:pimeloyl-ACP methyl ester carboxylesterase
MFELPPVRLMRVPTNGIHLNCAVAGEGPLLLMLHGFPEFWGTWYRQIPVLARHFKVVAPDLRGCGDSDKPPKGYDARTLADDILGLINTFGEGRPARIVAHDWGGFIAWALSYLDPDRLDRLSILNSPQPYLYRQKVMTTTQLFKSLYVLFFSMPVLPDWFLRYNDGGGIETVFYCAAYRPAALSKQYIAVAKAEMLKPKAIHCGLEYYRVTTFSGKKNIEFMSGVTNVPIQIIWGANDPALGVGLLDGLENYASHLLVHKLPKVGHWVNHEAPEDVNRLLLEWQLPEHAP